MKSTFAPRFTRALAPFLVATALVSIPAFAQDAAPQSAPPVFTPPSAAAVPIPPVVRTVPDGTPPAADAAPAAKPRAAAPRTAAPTRTVTKSTRTTVTRSAAPSAPAAAPAPEAAAPSAPPPSAPADTTAAAPPPPAAAPVNEPAPTAADTATTTTTEASTIPVWAWLLGGIAVLGVILGALMAMRRRRPEYDYDEPVYVEETYVEPEPAPVAVAPVFEPVPVAKAEPRKEPEYLRRTAAPAMEPVIAAPDEVKVESAPSEEVAALTAGEDHAERPWLEFAMRPVRAGTNVDEALVEIELTVGNAGSVDAKDVRISTFLLSGDVRGTEMERLLTSPPSDATTDPVTIRPGEGKRIDATLALLKSDMGENLPDSIRPIVVADARYTMADGSEGRTSASFVIGVTPDEGEGGLEPLELNRSSMHDNVAAELHGEPQHA